MKQDSGAVLGQNKPTAKRFLTTEFYLLLFVIGIMVILKFAAEGFYSVNNMMSMLNYFSYLLIGAIGMNLIIITGNIDVSAGAIISVISIVIAFAGKAGAPIWLFMPLGMAVGAGLSFLNGIFITKLRIPAIVATLATTQLFAGVLPLIVEGSVYDLPESFTWLAFKAKVGGIVPGSLIFAIVIAVIAIVFMKYSRFSKKLYAIGNNQNAAKLSGINVDKNVVIAYVIAGCLYGVTATIIATASQRVTTTMGSGFEMLMIAAVVLGGTSISGGSGRVIGTVIGAFILAIISPALNFIGLSSDWSDAVMGAIIIVAVVIGTISTLGRRQKVRMDVGPTHEPDSAEVK